jgi:hypothetical protein
MKISYERTGGFAGMRIGVDLDLQNLPAVEAAALENQVKEADFFHLTEVLGSKAVPDGFQHAITVESGTQKRTIRFADGAVPEALRSLLDDLSARALAQRRTG